ncbi:protein yellow-like [Cloeon dipterum]|uniref:protein yellow-like n=1 Tax=Cloeon dipterum TaxID=197152 RepID=UPI00321F736E
MTPFLVAIFLLALSSLTTAAEFKQVFEWDEMDYEWPSEESRARALEDGTFKPEGILPLYMAVHGTKIFLALSIRFGIPVSLVSLPTSSASSENAPPKLTPFPSWDMNGKNGDCTKIEEACGLEVDSIGRLWMLDSGSVKCNAKLWTVDLSNYDRTRLIHRFSFRDNVHDLVLDETPDGTFAYISRQSKPHIVVFSLERNQSWTVDTPGIKAFSTALSPKNQEPRQLYLSKYDSDELYSISVAALRSGTGAATAKLIGKWSAKPYRMLMDNHGTIYAAFWGKNYTSSWNSSLPFQEQRFHEVAKLTAVWPFTFALDSMGTFWMTVFINYTGSKPRCRLLKAAVGAEPNINDSPTTERSSSSSPTLDPTPETSTQIQTRTETVEELTHEHAIARI